ncbi:hypothetical protein AAG570_012976 [Ranatra chinensis]|uniref:PNPLA domain-containing protein n=1 Tax=Ranatra chinensis TaxID=642074 RepID=A0ABD0YXW1_9HEMI
MFQETINSRTTQLVASILSAESESSQLKRLDDLLQHLQLHTVGQSHAVREGAIDTLLTLRRRTNDGNVLQSIREVCAALGYIDPPPMQGVRILSIDGGGMRGIAVIRMLEQLEKLTGRKVYELFDYVCGVSTGAIITCCMVPPLAMSMESLCQLYRNFSTRVFQQSMIWGTSKLVWSHAYYDTLRWEKVLTETVGSTRLLETTRYLNAPKICAISTIVNRSYVIPFLFRNYTLPYLMKSDYQGSSNHTMFEAIRASAAAPTIFEEFRIGDMLHQDGGILVNNPTAVAVQESKALWPDEHLSSVISCGTGRTDPVLTLDYDPASQSASTWKGIFDKILESATDTEAVHTTLNSLLPENVYFRLNPPITVSVAIDETNEDNLSQLEDEVDMYYRRNEEKFKIIANKLLVPRSPIKKCGDYIKDRVKILRKV